MEWLILLLPIATIVIRKLNETISIMFKNGKIFNNDNPVTNGELLFYNNIKDEIDIIFDVGCRDDTLFTDFIGEVHYFEPLKETIENLSNNNNNNKNSYYNTFGLGDKNEIKSYYPLSQSFYDRRVSMIEYTNNKNWNPGKSIPLKIVKASDYIKKNNIQSIGFLKIDTEGYELNVIKGFGNYISSVKVIQFEYGGTYKDNDTKMSDIIDYLKEYGFINFSYLAKNCLKAISNMNDHYQYCNIVCFNKNL